MLLKFYNSLGSVTFSGKSYDSIPFKITAVEGLGFTDKKLSCTSYNGVPGTTLTGVSVNSRTITLKGDVPEKCGFLSRYASLLKVFDSEGWLEIHSGGIKRKIKGICTSVTEGSLRGAYRTYVIQIVCSYPYFSDLSETEVYLFNRTDKIDSDFTLPAAFTERISRSVVNCFGSTKIQPVFEIDALDEYESADGNAIIIKNHTSGEFIRLNYSMNAGEKITVDLEKASIYTDAGLNITDKISDDTFLDCFYLYPGMNDLEILSLNENTALTVKCIYSNKYIEAVV